MRLLLDTHTFLWALMQDRRLSARAKKLIGDEENELVFSMVSLWEASIKIRLGKLHSLGSSISYLRDEMKEYGMELLPIRYEHLLKVETLPLHHGDPFDRLLVAQAQAESLALITNDHRIKQYDVEILW